MCPPVASFPSAHQEDPALLAQLCPPQGFHFFLIICLFHQNFSPLMEARRCSTASTENLRVVLRIKPKQRRLRQKKRELNPSSKANTELLESCLCQESLQPVPRTSQGGLDIPVPPGVWLILKVLLLYVVLPWPCWFTRQKCSSWRAGSPSSAQSILILVRRLY